MNKLLTIEDFCNYFGVNTPKYYLDKETYYSGEKENIKNLVASGLVLGHKKNNFKPSLYLLELIAKDSSKKIVINSKAEWLFLCGRDVFKDSILKKNATEFCLVQNEKDENLGFGLIKGNLVKNMLDRGDFLRREK